ncbi:3-methyladenine DNA glycosylase [Nocardioides marmoriginsengisoli]|uniref:3-methyladenine DNA glycosylase n=1 Tax=Nocardioides marmoriginsengisoli TaxID=661483 RepID=A0A3N0CP08_9ACTN|nr:3-methyladenine DNA glycosylase [Nocardioides marmoriginsengisoli]RNL65175.1 3-methyladenine DNA glycosylase [Nocardioides marmoriginsengisoli]
MSSTVLARSAWAERARAHEDRVDLRVQPHLERRYRGEAHPVHDFLFTYYAQRPAALRRWHPGYGVTLAEAPEYDGLKGYAGGTVTAAHLASQRPMIENLHALLTATASRPPTLGCFGLHEWAMVYRSDAPGNEVRHPAPLRLGATGTDAVVEESRIGCSHFDAFRFFTPQARPLNVLQPGRDDRAAFEQPGCLHAGMDLYKHAFRLTPLIPSELVADAFELAWDIRILDMRAAPYDFTGLALEPNGEPWSQVAIETPEGRAEYVAAQRGFSERGAPIRQRLVAECERLIATADADARP